MDSPFDALQRCAVAAKRRDDRGIGFGGADQRKRDYMRKRDLLAASGFFQRRVQLAALRIERRNLHCAKPRRSWNRETLLHVADERGCWSLQRRELRLGRRPRRRGFRRSGRSCAVGGRRARGGGWARGGG